METTEAIRGRRSIRKFAPKTIDDSTVAQLLDLARHAPSSMNGQPWQFIVIRDAETKKKLAALKNKYCPVEKQEYQADFLRDAPVIVVICVDREHSFDREIENGILAAATLMLAAHDRGLGSVYLSAYKRDEPAVAASIRRLLAIPEGIEPVSIIPLGYPDETPVPKILKPLDATVSYEAFGNRK